MYGLKIGPELLFGAEAVGRLHQSDQQSAADGTDRGNLPQQSHRRMFSGFR
jgi:hypothetical protein